MTAIALTAGGGNFSTPATWSPAQIPVAGDTVTCGAGAGPLTFDGSTARACASLDFTGYTNTLTLSGSMTLTMTGNLTLGTSMSLQQTASTILFTSGVTITSNGRTWPAKFTLNSSGTFTLVGDWNCTALVTLTGSPILNGNTLYCWAGLTLSAGSNVTGTTVIQLAGTGTFTASTGSIANNFWFNAGGGATVTMSGAVFNYLTGTLTYADGVVLWGSTVLNFNGNATVNFTSQQPASVTFSGVTTLTISGGTFLATLLTLPNANVTFAGTFGFTVGTLTLPSTFASRTYTFAATEVYTVTTALDNANKNTPTVSTTIQGSDGTHATRAIFTVPPGCTQNLSWWNATDIDSSLGQTIFSYRGTVSNALNWATSVPIPQAPTSYQLGI
jgi:hypothetical protein